MTIDKERLGDFIKSVQYNLLPMEGQRSIGSDKDLFVDDWLVIEISKYFYIGKTRYMSEPIPKRLEENSTFSIKRIIEISEELLRRLFSLRRQPKDFDFLKVYDVGRGLSLLMALFIKSDFEKIFCFDFDRRYKALLTLFFGNKLAFYSEPDEFSRIPIRRTYVIRSVGIQEYSNPFWLKRSVQ